MLLKKYKNERFRLTDEEIRIEIAKRAEKEKVLIISDFDSMSKEEKAVALTQKRLGIGKWSVGGTEAIYKYNPEQYNKDKEERLRMGFNEFNNEGINEQMQQNQQEVFYEQNNAHDVGQEREDDF